MPITMVNKIMFPSWGVASRQLGQVAVKLDDIITLFGCLTDHTSTFRAVLMMPLPSPWVVVSVMIRRLALNWHPTSSGSELEHKSRDSELDLNVSYRWVLAQLFPLCSTKCPGCILAMSFFWMSTMFSPVQFFNKSLRYNIVLKLCSILDEWMSYNESWRNDHKK